MTRPLVPFFKGGVLALSLAGLLTACDSDSPTSPDEDGAVFLVRACRGSTPSPLGETFRVVIQNETVARQADGLVGVPLGDPRHRILVGNVRRGNGGVNAPWSWHVEPQSITFAELTIELCDGCPSMVESNVDSWINQVGQFCPWSTEVVRRER